MKEHVIRPVAVIHTDFREKFGIPRQSTLVPELTGVITFTEKYKDPAAIRGIEEFSHLWLLWGFSESERNDTVLTVHPPRLGGKEKRGVFATRSPFRPNSIGLSCVKLEKVVKDGECGTLLYVSGVDMLDGTPIYDIKPYMPYSDSVTDARGGFGQKNKDFTVEVEFPEELLKRLPEEKRTAAVHVLQQDPRAAYNKAYGYVYGLSFAGFDIRFIAESVRINALACDKLVVTDVIACDENFGKIK